MQNFDWGNFDVFDTFQLDRQTFTRQIFKALQHLKVHGKRQ